MAEECQVFFKIAKDLDYILDQTEMTAEEEEAANNLEWEMLEENELSEDLTEWVKEKSIHDFLRNDGPPRRRVYDYSTDGMKYVTSQMLDRANKILDRELEEPT